MGGAIFLLLHTPSWRRHGQLDLTSEIFTNYCQKFLEQKFSPDTRNFSPSRKPCFTAIRTQRAVFILCSLMFRVSESRCQDSPRHNEIKTVIISIIIPSVLGEIWGTNCSNHAGCFFCDEPQWNVVEVLYTPNVGTEVSTKIHSSHTRTQQYSHSVFLCSCRHSTGQDISGMLKGRFQYSINKICCMTYSN